MFGTKMIKNQGEILDRIKTKGLNERVKKKSTNFIDNFLYLSAFFRQSLYRKAL